MNSIVLCLLVAAIASSDEPAETMRLDFYHTGTVDREIFAVDRIVIEPTPWPGNPKHPIDTLNRGLYFFEVIDPDTKAVVYSRGFCSIFGEWVTTAEAKSAYRTFHESLRFPAPKSRVNIVVKKRDGENRWQEAWKTIVDPKDRFIDRARPQGTEPLMVIEKNGEPARKVDVLILGDGYRESERAKFEADARRLVSRLFEASPFRERKKDFNVWGLCPPSADAGISRPSDGVHRTTALSSTFDVFGLERYLLSFDNQAIRRAAAHAPYDFLVLLVNSPTYGGGGIYGLYSTVTSDSALAPYVFVHEFGHHLAGLADEYYTSAVAYLPAKKKVEPWEPNVTALLDPGTLKWKDLLSPGVPLPTPWHKEKYEAASLHFQEMRAKVRKDRRPETEYNAVSREHTQEIERMFASEDHAQAVGAFEGANYAAAGLYRPQVNCIMFTQTDRFCRVCERAIEQVIDLYTGE